jgi:hypothetical protein
MMKMLDTQRLRHLQLVSLSLGCAMVIRFVFDSGNVRELFTFMPMVINCILTGAPWRTHTKNLCLFYDAYNLFHV